MVDWRDVLRRALDVPGKTGWTTIVSTGSSLLLRDDALAVSDRQYFLAQLVRAMPRWPRELDRKVPEAWPATWRALAEHRVRETTQYARWERLICADVRLRLPNGHQGVRLRRRFVGAAVSLRGGRRMKIGEKGEPDLQGDLALSLPRTVLWVSLAIEVKTPTGSLSPEQRERLRGSELTGRLHLVCYTIEQAIVTLVAERQRLTLLITGGP